MSYVSSLNLKFLHTQPIYMLQTKYKYFNISIYKMQKLSKTQGSMSYLGSTHFVELANLPLVSIKW